MKRRVAPVSLFFIVLFSTAYIHAEYSLGLEGSGLTILFDDRFGPEQDIMGTLGFALSYQAKNIAVIGSANPGPATTIALEASYTFLPNRRLSQLVGAGILTDAHLLQSAFSSAYLGATAGLRYYLFEKQRLYAGIAVEYWQIVAGGTSLLPRYWIALPISFGYRFYSKQ